MLILIHASKNNIIGHNYFADTTNTWSVLGWNFQSVQSVHRTKPVGHNIASKSTRPSFAIIRRVGQTVLEVGACLKVSCHSDARTTQVGLHNTRVSIFGEFPETFGEFKDTWAGGGDDIPTVMESQTGIYMYSHIM